MKKIISLLLVLCLVLSSIPVSFAEETPELLLHAETQEVAKGKSITITYEFLNVENPKKAKISWSSSDKKIATVSKGKVTGKNTGTVSIECSAVLADGTKLVQELEITVYTPVKSISLTEKNISLYPSELYTINAKVTPEDARFTGFTFKSENDDIASVSSEGVIKAKKAGKTTITVTANEATDNKSASIKVKVLQPVKKISVTYEKAMFVGKSQNLKAIVSPDKVANKKLVYESLTPSIASVSSSGTVKAKKAGIAKIKISAKDGQGASETVYIECFDKDNTFNVITAWPNTLNALVSEEIIATTIALGVFDYIVGYIQNKREDPQFSLQFSETDERFKSYLILTDDMLHCWVVNPKTETDSSIIECCLIKGTYYNTMNVKKGIGNEIINSIRTTAKEFGETITVYECSSKEVGNVLKSVLN